MDIHKDTMTPMSSNIHRFITFKIQFPFPIHVRNYNERTSLDRDLFIQFRVIEFND